MTDNTSNTNPREAFSVGEPSGDFGPPCYEFGITCREAGHSCFYDTYSGDVDANGEIYGECACCGDPDPRAAL